MRNAGYINNAGEVVNDVDGPVVTHANPPFLISAFEFFTAGRPGNGRQPLETRHDACDDFLGKRI